MKHDEHNAENQTSDLQTCPLGNFTLENGSVIPDFQMTYVTRGTLNSDRSNAILVLHGLVADHSQLFGWAGPDSALDTSRYHIIFADTLAVTSADPHATTSPTRSGMNMAFPRFTIRDMVNAEHRMLTEGIGLRHIVAVAGVSMGGVEAMQWAVSFPDFMDAVIPVAPQARANRSIALLWEAARQAIMLDPKWRGGEYPKNDPPLRGIVAGLLVQSLFGGSPSGFEEQFPSGEAIRRFYLDQSEELASSAQARDWIYRTWALDTHDIAGNAEFGGSLAAAARSIRARTLLIVNRLDQLTPPFESGIIEVAAHIPEAKIVDMDDPGGHYAHRGRRGMALIADEIRNLLERISQGQDGFRGPRYPKDWTRAQVSPDR